MGLIRHGGKLLRRPQGGLANNRDCCCDELCECCDGLTVPGLLHVSSTWCGANSWNITEIPPAPPAGSRGCGQGVRIWQGFGFLGGSMGVIRVEVAQICTGDPACILSWMLRHDACTGVLNPADDCNFNHWIQIYLGPCVSPLHLHFQEAPPGLCEVPPGFCTDPFVLDITE